MMATDTFRGLIHAAVVSTTIGLLPAQDFRRAPPLSLNLSPVGNFFRLDLDGNGRDDAVYSASTGFDVGGFVLLNPDLTSPSGTVQAVYMPPLGFVRRTYFGDMNADGNIDLVYHANGIFGLAEFVYAPNDGMGGFGAPIPMAAPTGGTIRSTIGDFNGDGQMDAAFLDLNAPTQPLVILLQTSGTFTPAYTRVMTSARQLLAGDLDGDGMDELVWFQSGSMSILPGTAGTFGIPLVRTIPAALDDGFVDDMDRDGRDDIFLQRAAGNWQVDAFFGDPTNYLGAVQSIVASNSDRSDFMGPFDVDADGNKDLLFALRNTSAYVLIRNDGNRGFSPIPYLSTMTGGLIDLDQDGDLDRLVANFNNTTVERLENIAIFGEPCTGSNGAPRLDIEAAIPGNQTFALQLTGAAPNVPMQFLVGLVPATGSGACGPHVDLFHLLLPFDGAPAFTQFTNANGAVSLPLPLPRPRGIPEGPYYVQGIVLDPQGAFTVGNIAVAATGGRTIRVY